MRVPVRLLLSALLLLFTGGCGRGTGEHIDVAHNSWPGYEPLSLAQDEKLYRGAEVLVHRAANATDVIKAIEVDAVDIAAVTLDEAVLLQKKIDEPLVIIAVLDISNGGDALIARPDIASLDDLKGKHVGVEASALGAFVLSRALDFSKETGVHQLQIIPLTYDRHYDAYQEGEVDAIVTFEPVKTKLIEAGGKVLFDSSMIPNEIIDVLVVKAHTAREKANAVEAVVRGYFDALRTIKADPVRTNRIMCENERVNVATFLRAKEGVRVPGLEENRALLSPSSDTLKQAIGHIEAVVSHDNAAPRDTTAGLTITDTFLPPEQAL